MAPHGHPRSQKRTAESDGGMKATRDETGEARADASRASMERLALAIAAANDGLWDWDQRAGRVYRSARMQEILGHEPRAVETAPDDWAKQVHEEDVGIYRDAFRRYLKGDADRFECEYRLKDSGAGVRWILDYGKGLRDAAGRVYRMAGFVRDITAQKKLEEALRKGEMSFRDYTETASDWYWETGPDHRFTVHPERMRQLGTDPATRIGKLRTDFAADVEEEPEKWREHLATLDRHEPFRDFVYKIRRADGSLVTVSTSGKPVFDAAGRFLGYRGSSRDVTKATLSAEALRASEQRFSDIAEVAGDVIWEIDAQYRFSFVAGTGRDVVGMPDEYVLGKTRWELAGADPEKDELWIAHKARLEARRPFRNFRYSLKSMTGRVLHASVSGKPIFDRAGVFLGYRGTARNETNEVELIQRAAQQAELLRMTFASMVEGILVVDAELRIVTFNRQFLELCDYPADLVKLGDPFEKIVRFSAERGDYGAGKISAIVEDQLRAPGRLKPQVVDRQLPGGKVLEFRGKPLQQGGFVMTCVDVTERKESERKIARLARFDALTNLANRAQFTEYLSHATQEGTRYNQPSALFYVDLDNLKDVNDSLGHPVGDGLLRLVGKRLASIVREADLVARLGGDEFAVIQANLAHANDAAKFAERLVQTLAQPYRIGGHEIHATASIGVAISGPDNPVSAEELMKQADTALYKAKQEGRNQYCFHAPQMEKAVRARIAMADNLRKALAGRQLVLHYQPRFDLASGEVRGVEALLRWQQPGGELMSAAEFVSLTYDRSLSRKLDSWVIRHAALQMHQWQAGGALAGASVGVNIAPLQVKDVGFESIVLGALEESGLRAAALELELPEAVLLHANEALVNLLRSLDRRQVKLSISNFGSGFTAPRLLRRLPVAAAVISPELVGELGSARERDSTVAVVVELARKLGMRAVAKGVENEDQLRRLRECGCDEVQGFYLAPPVAADALLMTADRGGSLLSTQRQAMPRAG